MKEAKIVDKNNNEKEKPNEDYSQDIYQLPNIFTENNISQNPNKLLMNSSLSNDDLNSEIDFNQNIFQQNPIQESTTSSSNLYSSQPNENIISNLLFASHQSDNQAEKNNRPNISSTNNYMIMNNNNDIAIHKSMPDPKVNNKAMELFSSLGESKDVQLTRNAIFTALKNQSTTIILQKIIMESEKPVIESIIKELKGYFRTIMKDKNGNYFISDLIKVCEQTQRIKILEEIYPFLSEDCVNNFCTHPIQTLIEYSSSEKEYSLILESFIDYNKLLFASLDPNGAYVIQKIIERIPEKFRTKFNFIFISFISFVSKQKFGIITVKKFVSCTKTEEFMTQMVNLIKQNFMLLAVDKYGNYLIQFIFEKWKNIPEGNTIKELIITHFKVLSESKYSYFICELFLKHASIEDKMRLIKSIDLNDIKNSDNPHSTKILKYLGVINNNGNNINNQVQNQINLPMSLNNYKQNNNMPSNFMQFGNNNNININFENNNYKNNKYNNKNKKKNNNS